MASNQDDTGHDSQQLLAALRQEDAAAEDEVLRQFWTRLVPLIRRRMGHRLRQRLDPEDIAQSALRSFFARARENQFTLTQKGDLWRLLAAISIHKTRRHYQHHMAAKRSLQKEDSLEANPAVELGANQLPVEITIEIRELIDQAIGTFPPETHEAIKRYLSNQASEEIAHAIGKSPRTIRRWVQAFRAQLQQLLKPKPMPKLDSRATLPWEDYVLKQLVGSGGFGKVYRAIQKQTQRTVAIKSLHKRLQRDPQAIESFLAEAQWLAKVHHPGIIGIHGIGQYPGGGYFMALDWVDGEDLQQKINRGDWAMLDPLRVIRQVAQAIQAAHDADIVHGDLKPGNILVSRSGGIFVTDFGLARLRTRQTDWQLPQGGTLAYLAPEQLRAALPEFTIDVYGLGGLLHALLTGKPPREGSPRKILAELESDIAPLPLFERDSSTLIDPALHSLIIRCLQPDPSRRFSTVQEFLTALQAIGPLA
ncbi:protein kinase [bacterium]|nr:protein kinase [bacterium]